MSQTLKATTVSVSIERPPGEVYKFIANPKNLSRWASGLGGPVEQSGSDWIVETPDGPARIVFVEPNGFGVLDHTVYPSPDQAIFVPMRVVPNGSNGEVMLTVFRLPGMSDEKYAGDISLVVHDLETLKRTLEHDGA